MGLSAKALDDSKNEDVGDSDKDSVANDDKAVSLENETDDANGYAPFIWISLVFAAASGGAFVYLKRKQNLAADTDRGLDEPVSGDSSAAGLSKLDMPASGLPSETTQADSPSLHPAATATSSNTKITQFNTKPSKIPLGAGADDPCTFERFVEIHTAQACWSEQNRDIVIGLQSHFKLSMLEWSRLSVHWTQKYRADDRLMKQFTQLEAEFRRKYGNVA